MVGSFLLLCWNSFQPVRVTFTRCSALSWKRLDFWRCIRKHRNLHKYFNAFFKTFCTFGSGEFYDRHVKFPKNDEDYANNNIEFNAAGFTGACASTDAANIACDKLSWKTRQQHLGHKQSLTARTCNACVNHRRQILHATSGFPSRWNDQTIVKFDKFLNDTKCGKLCQNATFTLFERNENGEVQEVKYRGAWVICDNGYLKWSMLICPFKLTTNRSEIRFSEWLESMRKDVECAFGILKQR